MPPAVLQGTAVSNEHLSQSFPPRNEVKLRGSPSLQGYLEQLTWPSPADPPLQGTECAALSTQEVSLETLIPLVDYLTACKLLQKCVSMGPANCRETILYSLALNRRVSTG